MQDDAYRSPINVKSSGGPKCIGGRGLGACINVRECAQNTLPRVEILRAIADNIGMSKAIYTVVEGEDNYGISIFELFDSEAKARAYAEGRMALTGGLVYPWVEEPLEGAVANWQAGCDYMTISIKEVN